MVSLYKLGSSMVKHGALFCSPALSVIIHDLILLACIQLLMITLVYKIDP